VPRQVRLARRRADSAVKADRPRGWFAWRCLLHGDFAFYAWADKPYLIAALRLGGSFGLMRQFIAIPA
jgi:hypothetical protein